MNCIFMPSWGPVKSGGHYVRGEVVELLDEEEEEEDR